MKPPFSTPLTTISPSAWENHAFDGEVTEAYRDALSGQLRMLFRVRPDRPVATDRSDGEVDAVRLLLPGFGALKAANPPPSGLYMIPEIGSRVRVERMSGGTGWIIVGCLGGPVATALDTGVDGIRASLNPGMENSESRLTGQAGWDLPEWAGGLEPGDIVAGRGRIRVKLRGDGLFLGSDLDCCSLYTADGRRIDRAIEVDVRAVGYSHRSRLTRGADAEYLMIANPEVGWIAGECVRFTSVTDSAPNLRRKSAYLVKEQGLIHRYHLADGRGAVASELPMGLYETAIQSQDFVIDRTAVIHPLVPPGQQIFPAGELDPATPGSAYATSFNVTWANGSFQHGSGNTGKIIAPTDQSAPMDCMVSYDADAGEYRIRLGIAGAPTTDIKLRTDGSVFVKTLSKIIVESPEIQVKSTTVTVKATSTVTVDARGGINLLPGDGQKVYIDGDLEVRNGGLKVTGVISSGTDVKAQNISLKTHKHGYYDNADSPDTRTTDPPSP